MAGKRVRPNLRSENGVTLVELLAAIILLSIIVVSFMGFFTQAAKTNNQTNAVNEATYLAQEEIEIITHYSNSGRTFEDLIKPKVEGGLDFEEVVNGSFRSYEINGYSIETTITPPAVPEPGMETAAGQGLYKVLVLVSKGGETRAQMETHLPFAETTAETNPT
ncbi:MAG: type II secretion system protein [Eubacteriales bacterium]|nr:type II secretion system protein [Eubacteriales bacterium]